MRPQQSILSIAALLVAVMLFFPGCDSSKKILRQQENYRKLTEDFLLHHPFKFDTGTVVTYGKADTTNAWDYLAKPLNSNPNFHPAPYSPATLQLWDGTDVQKVKDSMAAAFAIQRQTEAIDCNRQVNEAFDVGYQAATHEVQEKMKRIEIVLPAPKLTTNTITNTALEKLQGEKIKTLEGQLSESRNKQSFLLHFIIAVIIDVILGMMLLRKSTAKI